jgi:hypothetical protein
MGGTVSFAQLLVKSSKQKELLNGELLKLQPEEGCVALCDPHVAPKVAA